MANVKKGNLASPPQWWKHLRDWKRTFWKRERRLQDEQIKGSVEAEPTRDVGREILDGIRELKGVTAQIIDSVGCEHCFPASAETAWDARSKLKHVAELVDESHYHVMVIACGACGQRFVSVFTETIDWKDGNDPQYWQVLPITREEADALVQARDTLTEATLNALGPGRRSLCLSHPSDGPQRIYWSTGVQVGFHD